VVSNGGRGGRRYRLLGYFASADNNVAVVTGAGSVWSNRLNLNVGFDGAGNRLQVDTADAFQRGRRLHRTHHRGQRDTVTVTGPGSAWTNLDVFFARS